MLSRIVALRNCQRALYFCTVGVSLGCLPGGVWRQTLQESADTKLTTHDHLFNGTVWKYEWQEDTFCKQPRSFDISTISSCVHGSEGRIVFLGGSTTRELLEYMSSTFNSSLVRLPCNFSLAHGCFDCARGCKTSYYWASKQLDWVDLELSIGNWQLEFSWKPEMFSLDDIRRLEYLRREKYVKAIVVHKGIHDTYDWLDFLNQTGMPFELFEEEIVTRARALAKKLKMSFPRSELFWRDAYHNWKDPPRERISQRLRDLTTPIFSSHNFTVIPGHELSWQSIPSIDGIHQHPSVRQLVLDAVFDRVCP